MPSIQPFPLIVATVTFLLAGFVKGVIGLGLPTVSMGLLTLVMAPAKAASLLIVPSFVTNVWQLAAGPSFRRLAYRLWPMLAGVVLGTLAGTGLLTGSHAGQAAITLGVLLILYAVLGLTSARFSVPPAAEWWFGPLIGVLTGLVTAATGVFVIPAVPYLGALNQGKEDMIRRSGFPSPSRPSRLRPRSRRTGLLTSAMSPLQPPRLRLRFSAWRRAELCAAGSASGPFGGCSSADCWCSALTSRRGR
jgi:Sulfite exporter TauE/SafE